MLVGSVEAADPQTVTIPSGSGYSMSISGILGIHLVYDISVTSGPNVDILLTDEDGYHSYGNGGLTSIPYLVQGSVLDTRHASYDGNLPSGKYYLIIDNSIIGTAESNGQAVQISYSISTSIAGIQTNPNSSFSADWLILIGIIITITGVIVIAFLIGNRGTKVNHQTPQMQYNYAPPYQPPQGPVPPSQQYYRPIHVNASGHCPLCNGIIEEGWSVCANCGWVVDLSRIRPLH